MKPAGMLLLILMLLTLTACGGETKVDMAPYLSVSYTGHNGKGVARVDFDFSEFEYGIMSQWKDTDYLEKLGKLTAVEMTITYAADISEDLSNGDTITVKIDLDEKLAKENGYTFTGLEKKFTVEGLTEAIEIDPFAEDIFGSGKLVDVTLEGTDPFVCLYIRNTAALGEPVRGITYKADNDWNLKNGDTVTVTATLDKKFEQQGYVLSRTECTITVEGFERYASAAADMTSTVLQSISDRAYQECVTGNVANIYEGNDSTTPWGVRFDNIHVGDTALLAVNNQIDMEYSFLLVPVYKTITTDEWYDMDAGVNTTKTWENVFGYYKFTDLLVHADGTVSYNESYVEMNGNFADASTAQEIYLNQFGSNYSFIEVSMP
ncbi:MAG: hypothetical protein E7335_05445 [Clostridiales bacterium]|nr:hypothetical protein [Clostridiales bacterium]